MHQTLKYGCRCHYEIGGALLVCSRVTKLAEDIFKCIMVDCMKSFCLLSKAMYRLWRCLSLFSFSIDTLLHNKLKRVGEHDLW